MMNIYCLLNESEKKGLAEILDGSAPPFDWNGDIRNVSSGFYTRFDSPYENQPEIPETFIMFEKLGEDHYEMSFAVNEDDKQAFQSDMPYYLRIVSTLLLIIRKFIKLHDTQTLNVVGVDKSNVRNPGQKNRIYFSIIEKNAPSLGYEYGHGKNEITMFKLPRKPYIKPKI